MSITFCTCVVIIKRYVVTVQHVRTDVTVPVTNESGFPLRNGLKCLGIKQQ